ncbi:MAG: SPOR domain-containing protein [Lentimicrobiaceae bacterium]|jgi:hypothetical protein|nr:SPOR domain-containing protein [Lentimicrobiaceae bacterium]MDD4596724.1 SPOR domain-containing protein [Lentimicrobiaceae bacterium]
MRLSLLVSLLFFCGLQASAQQAGYININADNRIELLMDKYIYLNRHQSTLDGWRVQIFFDSGANSKSRATESLNRFSNRYPETGAYLSFKEPYFRVRVGDFRTRLEAEGFLQEIHALYPNAFTVNDKINPPVLTGSTPTEAVQER